MTDRTYARGIVEEEVEEISQLVRAIRHLESRSDQQRLKKEYLGFSDLYQLGIVGRTPVELGILEQEAANLPPLQVSLAEDRAEKFVESLIRGSEARLASQPSTTEAEPYDPRMQENSLDTLSGLIHRNKLYLQEFAVYLHSRLPDDLGNNHSPEQFLHLALHIYKNKERFTRKSREATIKYVGDLAIQFKNSERGTHYYAVEPDMLLSFYDFLQALEDPLQS